MHSCSELCRNRTSKDVVEALQDLPGFVTAAWTAASSDKELSRTFYASFSSTRKARSGAVALSEDQDLLSNKGLTCNNGLTLIWQVSLLFLAQPRCNLDCHWKGIGTSNPFENPFYDSSSNINIWKRKSSTLSFPEFRPEGLWKIWFKIVFFNQNSPWHSISESLFWHLHIFGVWRCLTYLNRTADWKIPTSWSLLRGGTPLTHLLPLRTAKISVLDPFSSSELSALVLPPEMSMPERLQKDVELSGQVEGVKNWEGHVKNAEIFMAFSCQVTL